MFIKVKQKQRLNNTDMPANFMKSRVDYYLSNTFFSARNHP